MTFQGGSFTVSNLGMLVIDSFIATINPPNAPSLPLGGSRARVVADEGMFAVKSLLTGTLSADYRVDAIGARFLQEVKTRLERDPF